MTFFYLKLFLAVLNLLLSGIWLGSILKIMFEWITKQRIRFGLRIAFTLMMVITLFASNYLPAIFAVLMLILMELEDINDSRA